MINIPTQLQKEDGIKYLLLGKQTKIPLEENWQKENNYFITEKKLMDHLISGKNYGVLCGNGLIVIDADTERLQQIVKEKLPKTFEVKTKNGIHFYYFCIGFTQKKVLKDDDGHLGEIQSTGSFVVGANSIHPDGIIYTPNNLEIVSLTSEKLNEVLGNYFSSERVGKEIILHGAESGLRNDSMFKLACSFRAKELEPNETFYVLKSINEKNNPPLPEFELKKIIESAYRYKNKEEEKQQISDKLGNWKNYFELIEKIWEVKPFFYDNNNMWWEWDNANFCWKMTDEINIFNLIDDCLNEAFTTKAAFRSEVSEVLKRYGRRKKPKDAPRKWIQFKNKAFSLNSKNVYDIESNYFFCNPIPWELGTSAATPVIDKLFAEWVGKDYVETLYEIIAYCCYTDYPIHRIFALIGSGCNGKSKFQQLLRNFIGVENTTATELDILLDSRFESGKMFKKLACIMGETNFGVMNKTSLLKKLSGQDLIGFEFKNKTPFEDINYAKMIINSNSMPTSEDTSEGFYRRWLIIDFPNKFEEGRDILDTIPVEEYNNLAFKVTQILPKLLENGKFSNEGSIKERQERYILASNPLSLFISENCFERPEGYIRYSALYTQYVQYLKSVKKRIVSKKEFSKNLDIEGFEVRRTTKDSISDRYIEGLMWKNDMLIQEEVKMT